MDIDLIFKIAAIGIIVSILNQVLSRSGREEQATMTTLAGLVAVSLLMVFRAVLVQPMRFIKVMHWPAACPIYMGAQITS